MILVTSALIAAAPANGHGRAFELPANLQGQSILFAGAHPDDEWGIAPLPAEACIDRRAKCHFVVAADARSCGCMLNGGIRDPNECSRLRRLEMKRSAALFRATAEFFGWEDLFYGFNQRGMEKTLAEWGTAAGGREALVNRWVRVLQERKPSFVLTLDPRHGSTCHPGHRAVGTLVVEAVNRLAPGQRPQLWFEQSDNIDGRGKLVAAANKQVGYVAWPDTRDKVRWFDGNRKLRNGRRAYNYALLVRRRHATQYPDEAALTSKPYAPAALRFIPLAKYDAQMPADYCTRLGIELPSFDIPGNKEKFGIK